MRKPSSPKQIQTSTNFLLLLLLLGHGGRVMTEGSSNQCSNSATDQIDKQLEFLCNVGEQYVPKVGMTFLTYEEANDFYKKYAKRGKFASKIRNSNRNKKTGEIKNQLITCNSFSEVYAVDENSRLMQSLIQYLPYIPIRRYLGRVNHATVSDN
ncbi:hypothetical protein PIB30_076004 [Stylosanthes scabra]|uniref:FAR1 domain-containing protein n=1 Tax=Stylosanthes scabra TaxID=79078 RepID=A0ABU6XNH7_9FABA|nr:hypothetical protein [Stylosanthes scabra]